jgi:hypothetical protein
MNIERDPGYFTKRLDDRDADRDIGDEMAVHNIDMYIVGAGFHNFPHLVTQTAKIR